MDRRDQFAMAALPMAIELYRSQPLDFKGIAKRAYSVADAMVDEKTSRELNASPKPDPKTPTWRNHIKNSEAYTVLEEYDDGSAVVFVLYAGDRSEFGPWGEIGIMRITATGEVQTRGFTANGDWEEC